MRANSGTTTFFGVSVSRLNRYNVHTKTISIISGSNAFCRLLDKMMQTTTFTIKNERTCVLFLRTVLWTFPFGNIIWHTYHQIGLLQSTQSDDIRPQGDASNVDHIVPFLKINQNHFQNISFLYRKCFHVS